MFSKGTIYSSKYKKLHGEVMIAVSWGIKLAFNLIKGVSAGLLAFVILSAGFSIYPIIKQEVNYQKKTTDTESVSNTDYEYFEQLSKAEGISEVQKEASLLGLDSYFSLYIPKIEAKAKVIANVDTANEEEYKKALMEGVAHAKGTYFPGQGRTIYLFAHSTDAPLHIATYNAVFYLLRKLEVGDEITVFFADNKYTYRVLETQITFASDLSWFLKDFGEERLILQTCYPPGTTLKRLIVVAGLTNH